MPIYITKSKSLQTIIIYN